MIRVGVIGYGYWGPRVARNFHHRGDLRLEMICDRSPEALARAREEYPDVRLLTDPNEVIRSREIDAVAVVTPVWAHFDLAQAALQNGKHVWVEKPFTSTSQQASELIELGQKRNLTIMVDHTFLFTGAVRKIRELIDTQVLGPLYYYDSTRINLGLFQHDVNVVWDLAPHDLAIMDYLIDEKPEAVVATGKCHLNGLEDMAYITVYYSGKLIAHVNVNWLSPVKVRTTLVGGEKKMLVWNDLEADEKLRVYDKGVQMNGKAGVYELLVSYRSGDMWAPKVNSTEALTAEVLHFQECIRSGQAPLNDGVAGYRVVRLLEAASESLRDRGRIVPL